MKSPTIALMMLSLAGLRLNAMAQSGTIDTSHPNPAGASFRLYVTDKSCACIKTRKQTVTVTASDISVANSIYQVFRSRRDPKQELFRVGIGEGQGSDAHQLWNYGVADEADFNSDGNPDYSWYGGDDTGFEMYLFLSSEHGYTKVDVIKTLQAAWQVRFHRPAPNFDETESEYSVETVTLKRSASGLTLVGRIARLDSNGKRTTYLLSISQPEFKS